MIQLMLYEILHQKRMSQLDLAKKTGLSRNTISGIVTEKNKMILLSTVDSICNAIECQPCDLIKYVPVKGDK